MGEALAVRSKILYLERRGCVSFELVAFLIGRNLLDLNRVLCVLPDSLCARERAARGERAGGCCFVGEEDFDRKELAQGDDFGLLNAVFAKLGKTYAKEIRVVNKISASAEGGVGWVLPKRAHSSARQRLNFFRSAFLRAASDSLPLPLGLALGAALGAALEDAVGLAPGLAAGATSLRPLGTK